MKCTIPKVFVCMSLLLSCHHQTYGKKITLESFEQFLGQDIAWFDIRFRKYNRTATVANGTIHLYQDGTNDYQFQLDLFYSRLGNQQFNHMPIKIPTAGICDFADYIHKNYPGYMSIFVNGPKEGECPITKRDMYVLNAEFPSEAVPSIVVRNGLWKALIRCYLHDKEIINYHMILKASDN